MAPLEKQREWAMEERKLQPAYDDISKGKLKSADSLVRSILAKKPGSQAALALKVYLTERFSSGDAAGRKAVVGAYEEVMKTGELSGRSLWWVGLGLRNAGRADLALAMYQSAWKQSPEDSDLGEQVFVHAVQVWNLEVMTSCSRKLFVSQKGVWGRVGAWAEWVSKSTICPTSDRPFPPPSDPTAFKPALILLTAYPSTSPPSADHLWLHLQIHQSAGLESEALKLVRMDTSVEPNPVSPNAKDDALIAKGEAGVARAYWRVMLVQEMHRRRFGGALILEVFNGNAPQAKTEGEEGEVDKAKLRELWEPEWGWAILEVESERLSRNFLLYRHLIHATLALQASSPEIIAKTRERLRAVDDKIGKKERAPLLALLELDVLLRLNGQSEQIMPKAEWTEIVEIYRKRWGAKGSIVEDLRYLVTDNEADVAQTIPGETDQESFIRTSNSIKWEFVRRDPKTLSMDDVARTWAKYQDGLRSDVPKTDIQQADELGLLVVEMLLRLHREKQEEVYLIRAVLCLRYMVKRSPSQKRAQFMLVRMYRNIGAPSLAVLSLMALDIQEIQLDSMLHYFSERSVDAVLGQTDAAFALFHTKAEKMYKRSSHDLPEYVKSAMQHESYSRIPGLRDLQHRINTSLSQYSLALEETRLKILKDGVLEISPILEKVPVELSDNRDWDLLPRVMGDSVQRILRVGQEEISGEWIKVWARVLHAVARWSNGQAVEVVIIPEDIGMIPAERSYLQAVCRLLQAIRGATSAKDGVANGASSIRDLFEGMFNVEKADTSGSVQQCLQSGSSRRWDATYPVLLLAELGKLVDIVLKRMLDLTKPKKGRKPSPSLLSLIEELKAAQGNLQNSTKGILESLERLDKDDEGLRGALVPKDMFPDEEEAKKEIDELLNARKSALANLRTLFER